MIEKPTIAGMVFTSDGVDRDELMLRLNKMQDKLDRLVRADLDEAACEQARAMSHMANAAMQYEQLCAGVSEAFARAFEDEREDEQADGFR